VRETRRGWGREGVARTLWRADDQPVASPDGILELLCTGRRPLALHVLVVKREVELSKVDELSRCTVLLAQLPVWPHVVVDMRRKSTEFGVCVLLMWPQMGSWWAWWLIRAQRIHMKASCAVAAYERARAKDRGLLQVPCDVTLPDGCMQASHVCVSSDPHSLVVILDQTT
jgi:hypothetical protein